MQKTAGQIFKILQFLANFLNFIFGLSFWNSLIEFLPDFWSQVLHTWWDDACSLC